MASAGRRASSRCPHEVGRRYQICLILLAGRSTPARPPTGRCFGLFLVRKRHTRRRLDNFLVFRLSTEWCVGENRAHWRNKTSGLGFTTDEGRAHKGARTEEKSINALYARLHVCGSESPFCDENRIIYQ